MKEICTSIKNCKKLIIKDNYNWGNNIPSSVITHTKVTIKYKNTVYTIYDANGYMNEFEVLPTIFNINNTKIQDDFYQITIIYTTPSLNPTSIKLYSEVFNKCNLDCKIDNFIADYIGTSDCDSCNKNKEKDLLNIILKSELLCYAITCSKSKVWDIYNYINNILTDYNCNNC